MKKILTIALLGVIALTAASCGRAQANKITLWTETCGVKWRELKPGDAKPPRIGYCSYGVEVPAAPQQGDTQFRTKFDNGVLAKVEGNYDYSIVSGLAFVSEAKFLGRAQDGEDPANATARAFEIAENAVIDKRIQEVAREISLEINLAEMDQGAYDAMVLERVNTMLESRGVKLNFLSLVPVPDDQTRLALDGVASYRVWEAAGLAELGREVIIARAGAPQYHVTVESPKIVAE